MVTYELHCRPEHAGVPRPPPTLLACGADACADSIHAARVATLDARLRQIETSVGNQPMSTAGEATLLRYMSMTRGQAHSCARTTPR